METHQETALARDFNAFMLELRAAEARLDLEPGVAQYVELPREAAFRSGWHAGQRWQQHHDAEDPTIRCAWLSPGSPRRDATDGATASPRVAGKQVSR